LAIVILPGSPSELSAGTLGSHGTGKAAARPGPLALERVRKGGTGFPSATRSKYLESITLFEFGLGQSEFNVIWRAPGA
jgi:hypothetical protein